MLYIAEYSDIGSTTRGSIAIPLEPPIGEQALDVTPNSGQSTAFKPGTCIVKLLSDEDCMIDIGVTPDATNSARKLTAGNERTVSVPAGMNFKIAVMASNTGSVTGMDSLESLMKLLASPTDAQKQFAVLQDNVAKMTAAAKDLRAAAAESKTARDQMVQATQDAASAKATTDKAAADVAVREAAFDKDSQDHADKVAADKAASDARSKVLDQREAALASNQADLDKKAAALTATSVELDAREKDLVTRENAVAASQADYEARIGKLKALAS
jgi:hypothetical protein